jgi:membrane protein implicated in regulation of membrane protease activity
MIALIVGTVVVLFLTATTITILTSIGVMVLSLSVWRRYHKAIHAI